jgi:hypothetical protein
VLPNGLFSYQKIKFGNIFRPLEWKLLYFMTLGNVLVSAWVQDKKKTRAGICG